MTWTAGTLAATAMILGLMATAASAQINIGAIISITGPTAALGRRLQ